MDLSNPEDARKGVGFAEPEGSDKPTYDELAAEFARMRESLWRIMKWLAAHPRTTKDDEQWSMFSLATRHFKREAEAQIAAAAKGPKP